MFSKDDIKFLYWIVSTHGYDTMISYHEKRSCKNQIKQDKLMWQREIELREQLMKTYHDGLNK